MTLRRGDGPAPIRTPARRSSFFPTFFLLLSLIACRKEAAAPIPSPAVSSEAPPAPDAASEEVPARELLITEKAIIRVAKKVTPSVVNISTVHFVRHPDRAPSEEQNFLKDFFQDLFKNTPRREFRQKSLGSGFIISKEGFILTNHHVIAEADKITVKLSDRREFIGEIVAKDPKTDLAVIKIPPHDDLPVADLGDSGLIEVGEWAIAIGNPFGLDRTVTVGVISATGRTDLGLTDQENFLQTDASINFGNSGGPLLNAAGKVIGINTAIVASGQGIGFAIPINTARSIVDKWVQKEKTHAG